MKSAFWRSIAVLALVAAPMMANANDATIGSEVANNAMYGGTLMNTTAVFNVFPHMVVENGTGAELNTMGDGFGQVWWEAYDNLWLTMDVGRMDSGMSGSAFMWGAGWTAVSFMNPYDSFAFEAATMLNLGIAKPVAGGGAWAVGIQLAPMGGLEDSPSGGTTGEQNLTGYGFNASWGNGDGLDVSGEFAMTKWEDIDYNDPDTQEFSSMGFGVSGRYATELYIYQGNFTFTNGTYSDDTPSTPAIPDEDLTGLGFLASAGRYLKNEVDGQTTAEFGLGFAKVGWEQDDESEDLSAFLLPSVRVSSWEKITDRFGLMGGVGFTHAMTTAKDDDGTGEDEFKFNGSFWDWSAGIFFQPSDNVRIDARFSEGDLNYVASLGNDNEIISYLGLTIGLN